MKTNNSGYVIVRLPEFVGERWNDGPKTLLDLQGKTISYLGLDRDPWWDIDDLYYADGLSEEFRIARQHIIETKLLSFSSGVCHDFETVKKLLELPSQSSNHNEIILVTVVNDISESTEYNNIVDVLGYDCYADGYGSLIRLGFFQQADLFNDLLPKLNKYGLFNEFQQVSKIQGHHTY